MGLYKRHEVGKEAELKACQFLQAKGLALLKQNYHCRYGEIDLIMQDRDDIVFVEVRSRSCTNFGSALESINNHKIKKLIKAALHFLQMKKWLYRFNSRFDVIAIQLIPNNMQLEWFKNAFLIDDYFGMKI